MFLYDTQSMMGHFSRSQEGVNLFLHFICKKQAASGSYINDTVSLAFFLDWPMTEASQRSSDVARYNWSSQNLREPRVYA